MKTDRFSWASRRTAAAALAVLLAAGTPAAAQIVFRLGGSKEDRKEASARRLALVLAATVGRVQERFEKDRGELRTVPGAGGKPIYLRGEVAGLIARTGDDLARTVAEARPSGMEPMVAWVRHEMGDIQQDFSALPVRTAALPSRPFAPRAGAPAAVFASFARTSAAAPRQETVPAAASDPLLDRVAEVVGRLVFLAQRNDLEVELWVGTTPAPRPRFSFWPQGKIQGSTAEPLLIRPDGKRDGILRGLYAYRMASTPKKGVTELIQYPVPAGAPPAQNPSEPLDLVRNSPFFCCHFDEQSCHHVASETSCRP